LSEITQNCASPPSQIGRENLQIERKWLMAHKAPGAATPTTKVAKSRFVLLEALVAHPLTAEIN
jgi:hypothetical protein